MAGDGKGRREFGWEREEDEVWWIAEGERAYKYPGWGRTDLDPIWGEPGEGGDYGGRDLRIGIKQGLIGGLRRGHKARTHTHTGRPSLARPPVIDCRCDIKKREFIKVGYLCPT